MTALPVPTTQRERRSVRVFTWGVRAIVAGVFLYAGAIKAWDPALFQLEIERYRLVSPTVAWLSAAYLPYLEIFAAAALLHRRFAQAGRLVIAALLIVFIVALASAWARGLDITCGCFGATTAAAAPNYPWWIGRDFILLAMLGWLQILDRRGNSGLPRRQTAQG